MKLQIHNWHPYNGLKCITLYTSGKAPTALAPYLTVRVSNNYSVSLVPATTTLVFSSSIQKLVFHFVSSLVCSSFSMKALVMYVWLALASNDIVSGSTIVISRVVNAILISCLPGKT